MYPAHTWIVVAILADEGVGVGLIIDADADVVADADVDTDAFVVVIAVVVVAFDAVDALFATWLLLVDEVQPAASTAAVNNKTVIPKAIRFMIHLSIKPNQVFTRGFLKPRSIRSRVKNLC